MNEMNRAFAKDLTKALIQMLLNQKLITTAEYKAMLEECEKAA